MGRPYGHPPTPHADHLAHMNNLGTDQVASLASSSSSSASLVPIQFGTSRTVTNISQHSISILAGGCEALRLNSSNPGPHPNRTAAAGPQQAQHSRYEQPPARMEMLYYEIFVTVLEVPNCMGTREAELLLELARLLTAVQYISIKMRGRGILMLYSDGV
ncbi:hypothetical protein E4U58_007210 [Claviceps cyperi]|nr:hypothetical protein E4U58_007210 [Claviceps cyperi]